MTLLPADPHEWRIGLVGYGEVGRILAEDLTARGLDVSAYDIKLATPESGPLESHGSAHGVRLAASHADLAANVDLVVSAVTARQTTDVATACASSLRSGTWFLDLNSASPGAKLRASQVVDTHGGAFVEAAVMTAVPPYRLRVPILLGGARARELAPHLNALGFDATSVSDRVGVASATKMCRSVMIKGLEAMVIESLTAARAYGVEDQVLASLAETFPSIDWPQQATYFFQRVIQHGRRRAEEMQEAAETVREAGLDPWSAAGTADRQRWMADLADAGVFGDRRARRTDWRLDADCIRRALVQPPGRRSD